MIVDMVPSVREALAVSSSYDAVTIPAGIRRAIVFLRRTWTFQKAITRVSIPLVVDDQELALPTEHVGKILAVRLRDIDSTEFKLLRRTLLAELPRAEGPEVYWQEGNSLFLDTAADETGYIADVWYINTDPAEAEPWITDEFEDVVFTLSTMRLAMELRKPEVAGVFAAVWRELAPTLAQNLNELEFNDLAIRMRPDTGPVPVPRYGL